MEEIDNNSVSMPVTDFANGSIVMGKFEVLEFIASGGLARVYKVRDIILDSVVALKVLIVDSKSDKALVRFQSEARTASKLNHPNIAQILDFGLFEQTPYLSMEFVNGETLKAMCAARKNIPLPLFVEIFIQVIEGLQHAHSHGVVHRDLKPENIVVVENSNGTIGVKILDFGLAKRIDLSDEDCAGLTPTGDIVGTPLFMSPEQARGSSATPETDLYSLGCLMWFCLTGDAPLHGDTAMETLMMHQTKTPPPLSVAASELALPDLLCVFVDGLLKKESNLRPLLKDTKAMLLTLKENMDEPKARETDAAIASDTIQNARESNRWLLFACVAGGLLFIVGSVVLLLPTKDVTPTVDNKPSSGHYVSSLVPLEVKHLDDLEKRHRRRCDVPSDNKKTIERRFKYSDSDINALKKLDQIEFITLSYSPVTEACFEHLSTAPMLKNLGLDGTKVTTLSGIEKLKNLRDLDLRNTSINDASIERLAALPYLTKLSISNCKLTDSVFDKLALLRKIEWIDLDGNTAITGANAAKLKNLKKLQLIHLNGCSITKDAVLQFARLPGITTLEVECRGLDRAFIDQLSRRFPCVAIGANSNLKDLEKLAVSASDKKSFKLAIQRYKACIYLLKNNYGKDSLRLFPYYVSYSDCASSDGDSKTAREMLKLCDELARLHGDELASLTVLDRLTTVSVRERVKITDADLQKANQLAERILPTVDFEVRCFGFGNLFKENHMYGRALPYYQQSLRIREKLYGKDSLQGALVMVLIGDCQRGIKQTSLAWNSYKSGLKILERSSQKETQYMSPMAYAYAGLAQIEDEQGHYKEAVDYSKKARDLFKYEGLPPVVRAVVIQQRIKLLNHANLPNEIPNLAKEYDKLAARDPGLPQRKNGKKRIKVDD